jgi:hypothetical protein
MTGKLSASDFQNPAIRLSGKMADESYEIFREQLGKAPTEGLVVVEVSTPGGNPEVARMIGEDIRFASQVTPKRRFVFLGKTFVYSAGATLMSYFLRENRYFTRDTWLMVHERQQDKKIPLNGPLTSCRAVLEQALHEVESSIRIQDEGFSSLVRGSCVSLEEIREKARSAWYLDAEETLRRGLIAALV